MPHPAEARAHGPPASQTGGCGHPRRPIDLWQATRALVPAGARQDPFGYPDPPSLGLVVTSAASLSDVWSRCARSGSW